MGRLSSPNLFFLVIFYLCICLSLQNPSCNDTEIELLSKAFAFVSGFRLSLLVQNCSAATELRLPSRNLEGTISWYYIREISGLRVLDLSGNSLRGSIPTIFWSAQNLKELNIAGNRLGGPVAAADFSSLIFLNLSGNRFTNSIELYRFRSLRFLDLSNNNLRTWPSGLSGLTQLKSLVLSNCNISGDWKILAGMSSLEHLDISHNQIMGLFPYNLSQLAKIKFLNISFNRFTGRATAEDLQKFGSTAFLHSGVDTSPVKYNASISSLSPVSQRKPKFSLVWGTCLTAGFLSIVALVMVARWKRCSGKKSKELRLTAGGEEGLPPWVAEIIAGDSTAVAAPVVIVEKPLLRLTFMDLIVSTSGFGEESKLACSRDMVAVYRAVLPGDLDVVIKTQNCPRTMLPIEELRRLKHPNVLPLLGFCMAGKFPIWCFHHDP